MNKILLFIVFFASISTASAQDVIVKKDRSTILSKVIEISTTEVKYKKWNNQNGPNYTIPKSDVKAINYENGEIDTFSDAVTQQPQQEFNYINYTKQMEENMSSSSRYQKEKLLTSAKAWRSASFWAGLIPFAGGIVAGLILDDTMGDSDKGLFEHGTYWLCCGVGLGVGIAGIAICHSVAKNKEHLANTITASHIIHQDFNIGKSNLSVGIDLLNNRNFKEKAIGLGLCLKL